MDIQKRQVSLSEIRTRERRATLLTTLYTLGAWIVYVAAWYLGLFKWSTASQKAVRTAPVIIGPIVYVVKAPRIRSETHCRPYYRILFTRRIVQIWYARIGDKEGAFFFTSGMASLTKLVFRENLARVIETTACKSRGNQEEDQLQSDTRVALAV